MIFIRFSNYIMALWKGIWTISKSPATSLPMILMRIDLPLPKRQRMDGKCSTEMSLVPCSATGLFPSTLPHHPSPSPTCTSSPPPSPPSSWTHWPKQRGSLSQRLLQGSSTWAMYRTNWFSEVNILLFSVTQKYSGETVLFAYEEAIGFMCGSAVLDKVSLNQNSDCKVTHVWFDYVNQFVCLDHWIPLQDGVSALVCLSELITRFPHWGG